MNTIWSSVSLQNTHAQFNKHLFSSRKNKHKSRFFQLSENPPLVHLFPAFLAPPRCHQTPTMMKVGIEPNLIITVAIALFVNMSRFIKFISLTLGPGVPGGPVGPSSP